MQIHPVFLSSLRNYQAESRYLHQFSTLKLSHTHTHTHTSLPNASYAHVFMTIVRQLYSSLKNKSLQTDAFS